MHFWRCLAWVTAQGAARRREVFHFLDRAYRLQSTTMESGERRQEQEERQEAGRSIAAAGVAKIASDLSSHKQPLEEMFVVTSQTSTRLRSSLYLKGCRCEACFAVL